MTLTRRPLRLQNRHQPHRAEASIAVAMNIPDDAFLGEAGLRIDPARALVMKVDEQLDAMRGQLAKADVEHRTQELRADPALGIARDDASQADAAMRRGHALQN